MPSCNSSDQLLHSVSASDSTSERFIQSNHSLNTSMNADQLRTTDLHTTMTTDSGERIIIYICPILGWKFN